jgi:hypothetical protein
MRQRRRFQAKQQELGTKKQRDERIEPKAKREEFEDER